MLPGEPHWFPPTLKRGDLCNQYGSVDVMACDFPDEVAEEIAVGPYFRGPFAQGKPAACVRTPKPPCRGACGGTGASRQQLGVSRLGNESSGPSRAFGRPRPQQHFPCYFLTDPPQRLQGLWEGNGCLGPPSSGVTRAAIENHTLGDRDAAGPGTSLGVACAVLALGPCTECTQQMF